MLFRFGLRTRPRWYFRRRRRPRLRYPLHPWFPPFLPLLRHQLQRSGSRRRGRHRSIRVVAHSPVVKITKRLLQPLQLSQGLIRILFACVQRPYPAQKGAIAQPFIPGIDAGHELPRADPTHYARSQHLQSGSTAISTGRSASPYGNPGILTCQGIVCPTLISLPGLIFTGCVALFIMIITRMIHLEPCLVWWF